MSKILRTMGGILFTALLVFSISVNIFAYTVIDTDKTGSITITPASGETIGMELTIYQVAGIVVDDADQMFVLTEDFEDSLVDLTNLDNPDVLAQALYEFLETQEGISGTTKAVDENGAVKFENLQLGLYLIVQATVKEGEAIVHPFLVSVPLLEDDNWVYDVNASPKAGTLEAIDLTVVKYWNDGEDEESRPESITVNLYSDTTLIDTVVLNEENEWTYTWIKLPKSDSYSVKEVSIKDFVATYEQYDNLFIITNTPKLPQTGQLNWPIPFLALGGLALFGAGYYLVFLKREKDA